MAEMQSLINTFECNFNNNNFNRDLRENYPS